MNFREMVRAARECLTMSQKDFAEALGFTAQYLCDLEKGRRLGSVEFVNRVCNYIEVGPTSRRRWHVAAAKSHGWEI